VTRELHTVHHLHDTDLKRADDVFASLSSAPSLRLLVRRDDISLMIEHAWWVGRLHNTAPYPWLPLPGGRPIETRK
jgi:hypothetical protein